MPSFQHALLRLSVDNMRHILSTKAPNIPAVRNTLDWSASSLYLPNGVQAKPLTVAGVPAEWLTPKKAEPGRVLLFLHGGGYAVGSITTHRALAAKLAHMTQSRALIIDYRLAPEHPFPAALEDAVHAYQWLLSQGYQAHRIALAGDSAGGGLCIALQVCLKEIGLPLPAASVLFSPWVDLSFSGESVLVHQDSDPVVRVRHVCEWAAAYAATFPLRHPMVSPLFADLSDLSPVLIQASDSEVLTDDAVRLSQALGDVEVESHLQLYPKLLHVWHLFWRYVPEAMDALQHAADFMVKQLNLEAQAYEEALPETQEKPLKARSFLPFRVAV